MIPFYENKPNSLYCSQSKMNFYPAHLHTNLELLLILDGTAKMMINNVEFTLQKNQLAVIFPNVIHSYISGSADCDAIMLICGTDYLGENFNQMLKYSPKFPVIEENSIHGDVKYAIKSMFTEYKSKTEHNKSSQKALTQLIVSRILPVVELQKNSTALEVDITIKLIRYICDNFKNELSLDLLSHELGVNRYYISRIFTNRIGTSFTDYINNLRIDFSKKLLTTSNFSIQQISDECGFETQRSFNRIFKKFLKMTPMQYRKTH